MLTQLKTTQSETLLIQGIINRFERVIMSNVDHMSVLMDLEYAHAQFNLNLLDLYHKASDDDVFHDVWGIIQNMNRDTGEVENCFLPRYTK